MSKLKRNTPTPLLVTGITIATLLISYFLVDSQYDVINGKRALIKGRFLKVVEKQTEKHTRDKLEPRSEVVRKNENRFLSSYHLARPFLPWKGSRPYEWCVPQDFYQQELDFEENKEGLVGLMYVKNPKAGSTTGEGVTIKIARNLAQRLGYNKPCASYHKHTFYHPFKSHGHRKNPSILWTTVRHPGKRVLSHCYYLFSKGNIKPTPEKVLDFITNERVHKNAQLNVISTENSRLRSLEDAIYTMKAHVINKYDFIGVTERLAESLVALKLLFGLEHGDVILLASKSHGSRNPQTCEIINSPTPNTEVENYLATDFTVDNYDYLLYEVANLSLDLTIESLGVKRFQEELAVHKRLQDLANEKCLPTAIFPCTPDGQVRSRNDILDSCYFPQGGKDSGCGYKCVQHVLEEAGLS